MEAHGGDVTKVWNLSDDHTAALFAEAVNERGMRVIEHANWSTSVTTPVRLPDGIVSQLRILWPGTEHLLLEIDGCDALARLELSNGRAYATVGTSTPAVTDGVFARLRELAPPMKSDGGFVPVTFWFYSPNGPRSATRPIAVPTWEKITPNYTASLSKALSALMGPEFRPAAGGQLLLWQGPPGTGKTWALRALAHEWRSWADIHYITDPENFFGEHADYLLDVLLHDDQPMMYSLGGGRAREEEPKWKLLLLEDTGELLSADAKERSGQALSRLLNVVDGIIGQGLRVLVLVTTNEEIRTLHEAVSRPGRCAASVPFAPLTREEASEWCERHDLDPDSIRSRKISDLYAALAGDTAPRREPVGFAG